MEYLRIKGRMEVLGKLHDIAEFFKHLDALGFPIARIPMTHIFDATHRMTEWHNVQLKTIASDHNVRIRNV
jgi:hypothetical protein